MKRDYIVFCDFDGTITTEDGFVHVCNHFAPEESERFMKEILTGKVTLKTGIRRILESIPSADYPEMLNYVNQSKLRPGFETFLDYLSEIQVPVVVVSGGLKGLVERQLGGLMKKIDAVYAADVDASGDKLTVVSEFEGGTELVNKQKVMARYDYKKAIAIGDGITDHNMAIAADIVFARKHLARFLEKKNQPFQTWSDFNEIKTILMTLL